MYGLDFTKEIIDTASFKEVFDEYEMIDETVQNQTADILRNTLLNLVGEGFVVLDQL